MFEINAAIMGDGTVVFTVTGLDGKDDQLVEDLRALGFQTEALPAEVGLPDKAGLPARLSVGLDEEALRTHERWLDTPGADGLHYDLANVQQFVTEAITESLKDDEPATEPENVELPDDGE